MADTNEILLAASLKVREAEELLIVSVEDEEAAARLLKDLKDERDSHERSRVSEKEPHLEAGRRVDERWKPILTALDNASGAVTRKIRSFREAAAARAREEERRAREEQERERLRLAKQAERAEAKGLTDTADALVRAAESIQPAIVPAKVSPRLPGLNLAEHWNFVIEEPSRIPREYLVPDEAAIRRYVNAMKGRASIAGVRIFREDSIRRGR